MADDSHTSTQAPASSSEVHSLQQNTEPTPVNGGTTTNGNGVVVGQPLSSADVPASNEASNSTKQTNDVSPKSWFRKTCKTAAVSPKLDKTGSGLLTAVGPDQVPTVFASNNLLWNGTPQILSYYFIDGSSKQHTKVRQVIEEWTNYANVVFQQSTSAEQSNIRIRFDQDDGNWSYVGRQAVRIGSQDATMNLASLDAFSDLTATEAAVALHEFGHVLGLLHEHQAPARGGVAVRNVQAALDLYRNTQGWSDQDIYDQVINVYKMSDVSNFSQVDTKSIMHYPQPKELTGLDHDIGYNLKLTDLDKAYMTLQYPRAEIHPKAAAEGWTYNKALQVLGTPPDVTKKVLEFIKEDRSQSTDEITPTNIRKEIEDWRLATLKGGPSPSSTVQPQLRPLHGAVDPPRTVNSPPAHRGDESFIPQLYEKLKAMYCSSSKYLSLQYPTRSLDKQSYAYELDSHFSRFNKPVVVNEAEFALTDALYSIAPIVGGPNSQTLSKNYEKALNSLIPTFDTAEVRKQRERMRNWLLKETKPENTAFTVDARLAIPGIDAKSARELSEEMGMVITPGQSSTATMADQTSAKIMAREAVNAVKNSNRANPRGMTRMEFSDSLMQEYLNDRKAWELRRDEMISEASKLATSDPGAMEKFTRTLAHVTALENAKLSSKHADAVVRGHSHTVRTFMGHLDVKSVAESLQDAKDSFRESAVSSLYSASSVYPVAMLPADWFEALDTGFTREDMTQDPELIAAAIRAKGKLVDNLENQIANLRASNRGDPTAAKANMEAAAAKRETAMSSLYQKYTASTISAVKLAIDSTEGATPAQPAISVASRRLDALAKLGDDDPKKRGIMTLFGGDLTALKDIGIQMDEVAKANAEVNAASRLLSEHMREFAIATAGETRTLVDGLQRQLTTAKKELAELQESFTVAQHVVDSCTAAAEGNDLPTLEDAGKLPPGNGDSRWSELHISTTVSNDYTKSESPSASSANSFQCNFWIGSELGNSSQSKASNIASVMGDTLSVDISMRVTHVTVDRSGWFDPSVFEMSKSFMRNADDSTYAPWATWKEGITNASAAADSIQNEADRPGGYLAAFPVGYILVKDIVLKVSSNGVESSSFKSHFDKQAENSGGFLCFSHSSASRSSTDSNASSTVNASGGVVVRIPGPQILGYIMQLTAKDETTQFVPTSLDQLFLEGEDDNANEDSKSTPPFAPPLAPVHPAELSLSSDNAPVHQAAVRKYDDDFTDENPRVTVSSSKPTDGSGGPANGIQVPATAGANISGSSRLADALKTALDDDDVSRWLGSQPSSAREELLKKISDAFARR